VRVVDVEQVYAQFGWGIFDPQAIKDYISHAAALMGTRYVLLVGGDTYDYRGYLEQDSISFVPSLYAVTDEFVTFAPVDPLFTDLDGDELPDLPIGRFPVRTETELAMMVNKTLAYAGKDYGRTAIFAADGYEPTAGLSFSWDSNRFALQLPEGWDVRKVYLDQRGVADAKTALTGRINEGVALTNFIGHSGLDRWTLDGLFFSSDAAALTNVGRPTVVTQWGCWNTYHVDPRYNTLGHRFLLSGEQAAVAVLGAATLTDARHEEFLGHFVMDRVADPGVRMGDAIQEAKEQLAALRPGYLDVLLGWTLLGDPALVIDP
jgi:hypothetical protein